MTKLNRALTGLLALVLVIGAMGARADAQTRPASSGAAAPQKPVPQATPAAKPAPPAQPAPGLTPPTDYIIGADDVLIVMFRREKDMSSEVVVRPDGRITIPLLDELQAAGLTPAQLRDSVTESAKRFVEEPAVTVIVKQINSRKVFITGQINRPGPYPLGDRMTVMQLIAMAGGVTEFAKKKDIVIIREAGPKPGSRPMTFKFNYEDIQKLRNLSSNIELKTGDTVIVP
jgi:polysaccharide export outer membrane protein